MVTNGNVSRLLRDQVGSVYAEAAIMLPFFATLFFALMYVRGAYVGRQARLVRARGCAWEYSNAACDGGVPAGCAVAGSTDMSQQNTRPGDAGSGLQSATGGQSASVLDKMTDLPVIGGLLEAVFGTAVAIDSGHTIQRPEILGGGDVRIAGDYYIMCNEKKTDPLDIIVDYVKGLFSGG